ncbi:MAG: 50S ribosomal protein L18 [Ignavibacteriae bacterium]|nr:50S ribosomal protein L18 [Ignavibacteriota bacterium]MCB9216298.1 50S ribosomal protein L18 [Ignavibacteria bacterium]
MSQQQKYQRRLRRKRSIRKTITGTAERPRLSINRSLKHVYLQAIDDVSGHTVAAASSLNDELVQSLIEGSEGGQSMAISRAVGKAMARRLKEKNIERAVFDRNGFLYHGRIKAVADGAREEGLNF